MSKKIVFFSVFPPFRGGISKFSNQIAQYLQNYVSLVSINFKKQYPDILFPGRSQYDSSKPYKEIIRCGSTFNLISFIRLSKKIKNENPDVFITSYWMTFMAPILSFVSKRQSSACKRILIVHNFIPHEKRIFDSFMNKMLIKSFDIFIVLSEKVKNDMLSIDDKLDIKLMSHPVYNDYKNKINVKEARELLKLNSDRKTILFFGLIRPYKGLDILLKAFALLPKDFQLIIAGEVYGSSKIYDKLISQSENKNILFLNTFIPDNHIHIHFSAADLCVLPYKSGTQSGVKSIADYFEIPCLVSNVGGISEQIINGENGFLIENNDEKELSYQIKHLFDDNKLQSVQNNLHKCNLNKNNEWDDFAKMIAEL